jgi:anti-anti-sigma regulatory factor
MGKEAVWPGLTYEGEDRQPVLCLTDDIARVASQYAEPLIAGGKPPVLDFDGMGYLNSLGVGQVVALHLALVAEDMGPVRVRNMSNKHRRVAEMAGFEKVGIVMEGGLEKSMADGAQAAPQPEVRQ